MQAWAVRKYQKNINFWFGVDTYKKICQIYDYIVYHKINKINFCDIDKGEKCFYHESQSDSRFSRSFTSIADQLTFA